jgi:hypothetical protein
MTALDTLKALAAGERPPGGLLHSCRFEGFGGEAYGEEAIVERFRAAEFDLPDDAVAFQADGHAAIFAGDCALFADVAEGGISRLWVLSDDEVAKPEPGVSVVFDPDLSQARGDFLFAASDHPALDAGGAAKVEALGASIARDDPGYRTRAFAIRAFGEAARGAALFAVHRLQGDDTRTSGFACAAVCWGETGTMVVRDRAGEDAIARAAWTPRIGA